MGFPGGSDSKESACNLGDPGSTPGLRRSPGEGNDFPLQYSCLGNSMDRRAWRATVHGVAKGQTRLSDSVSFIAVTSLKDGKECPSLMKQGFRDITFYYSSRWLEGLDLPQQGTIHKPLYSAFLYPSIRILTSRFSHLEKGHMIRQWGKEGRPGMHGNTRGCAGLSSESLPPLRLRNFKFVLWNATQWLKFHIVQRQPNFST